MPQSLNYWRSSPIAVVPIPTTTNKKPKDPFDQIYSDGFKATFPTLESYRCAKVIFEIIAANARLSIHRVADCASIDGLHTKEEIMRMIEGPIAHYLLVNERSVLGFQHKSIFDWITTLPVTHMHSIDLSMGLRRISIYCFLQTSSSCIHFSKFPRLYTAISEIIGHSSFPMVFQPGLDETNDFLHEFWITTGKSLLFKYPAFFSALATEGGW